MMTDIPVNDRTECNVKTRPKFEDIDQVVVSLVELD